MKKNYLGIILASFACLALLNACKKDKDKEPAKTIVGKWMQISGTYSPAYNGETDFFSASSSCDKDDIYEFKSDNTYEASEGATKCDVNDPQIFDSGNYSVNSTFTSLNIAGQTLNMELTATNLKLTDTFTDNGVTYTVTSNYQRQ
jgi:hypothetical protein